MFPYKFSYIKNYFQEFLHVSRNVCAIFLQQKEDRLFFTVLLKKRSIKYNFNNSLCRDIVPVPVPWLRPAADHGPHRFPGNPPAISVPSLPAPEFPPDSGPCDTGIHWQKNGIPAGHPPGGRTPHTWSAQDSWGLPPSPGRRKNHGFPPDIP